MTTAGPNGSGTQASVSGGGTSAWGTPSAAATENGTGTEYDATADASETLKLTNFGFSIPAGATINGITVRVKRKRMSSGANMHDALIKLYKAGTLVGSNKADTGTRWPTTFTFATYGSSSDLWGTTWSYSDINNSGFGVGIEGSLDIATSDNGNVDFADISIDYTAGGGSTKVRRSMSLRSGSRGVIE